MLRKGIVEMFEIKTSFVKLAAVIGVAASFLRLLSAGTVTSGFLLLFLLIWALPVVLISLFLHL